MNELRDSLGSRVRVARDRLRLTQKELADEAGLPAPQVVSQIEKGQREVKAWELVNLAKVLRVEISDLLSSEEIRPRPIVLWREYPRQNKELIESAFLQHCHRYGSVEQLCGACTERDLPQKTINIHEITFGGAEELAEDTRQEFDLGSRPARSLVSVLEDRFGTKIWYESLGPDGSAASTKDSFGPGILMNADEAPWRRNFSFAHEVFHLITWDSVPSQLLLDNSRLWDKAEKLANAFASCLLLPADAVTTALFKHVKEDKVSFTDVIEIAREFDVSADALLVRLAKLSFLTKESVESLRANPSFRKVDRESRKASWWTPPRIPERFVRLAFMAYLEGRLSRARLAQYLDTSLIDLSDFLLEYGFNDREDYKAEVRTPRR